MTLHRTLTYCLRSLLPAGLAFSLPFGHAAARSADPVPAAAYAAAAGDAASNEGGVFGLGLAYVPRYPGSDRERVRAVPLLEYHWSNGLFVGGERQALLGFQAAGLSGIRTGIALGVDEGRKAYRDGDLAGQPGIATRPVLALFAKLRLSAALALDGSVRLGSGTDRRGGLLKLQAAYRIPVSPALQLGLQLDADVANGAYMRSYFGLRGASSTMPPLDGRGDSTGNIVAAGPFTSVDLAPGMRYASYAPGGGLLDVKLGLQMTARLAENYMLLANAGLARLGKDAADSPFVRQRTSRTLFVGVARSFGSR